MSAFASPDLPGDRLISVSAAVEALDLMLDEFGVDLTPMEADTVLTYACQRYQRGEVEGARKTLSRYLEPIEVYRIEAVLHTPRADERAAREPDAVIQTVEGALITPTPSVRGKERAEAVIAQLLGPVYEEQEAPVRFVYSYPSRFQKAGTLHLYDCRTLGNHYRPATDEDLKSQTVRRCKVCLPEPRG